MSGDSGNTVAHVFISYARKDADHADALQGILEAANIPVWRDKSSLLPGDNWPEKVRTAIAHEALFCLICFSSASIARGKGYQNEEIVQAIEQLRLRHSGETWLIPVRFDECEIPEVSLGAGRTLATIHSADLFGSRYDEEAAKLIEVISQRLRVPARPGKTRARVVPVLEKPDNSPGRPAAIRRRTMALGACVAGSLIAAFVFVVVPGLLTSNPSRRLPATYSETAGGATNTWSDYFDAGGSEGITIPAYMTVQVACRVRGLHATDGNTWWYKVATSPWDGGYYASADAFYNNGRTSGSLHGTPFYDSTVPAC